jgi:biotin synthase
MTQFLKDMAAVRHGRLSEATLARLLSVEDDDARTGVFAEARRVKHAHVGPVVYVRGLVELSNICRKNCFYCGIRRGNGSVARYALTRREAVAAAVLADRLGYASLVLQAGERDDPAFIDFVEDLLHEIHRRTDRRLGVTLSLGEQTARTYERWFAAGARRYLLRIETSNPELYRQLHPEDHRFEERVLCLRALRDAGYQVGTGVMIGLPGQTALDLARDLLFYRDMDVDMIGMGPFVPHDDTPMATAAFDSGRQLSRALTMVAVTRLALPDVNIAATTALEALHPAGRELALRAGANVVMPNLTDVRYRSAYRLYNNKPCGDGDAARDREALIATAARMGETVGFGRHGDSPHYGRRADLAAIGGAPC